MLDIGISFNKRWCGGDAFYKILSDIGYKAIDLDCCNTEKEIYYTAPVDEAIAYAKEERKKLAELGMYVNQVHGPWKYPPCDATVEDREVLFGKCVRAIIATHFLGAKYMVMHPLMPFGAETMPPEKKLENYLISKEFFRRLAGPAKDYGVVVCIENMPMKGYGIAKPTEVAELVNDINDENIKMCLDTGHAVLLDNVNLAEEIYACGDIIKTLHIHDNKGVLDDHTYPYFGIIDWKSVMKALGDIGYCGVVNLETDNPTKLPPELQAEVYTLYFHIAEYLAKQIEG